MTVLNANFGLTLEARSFELRGQLPVNGNASQPDPTPPAPHETFDQARPGGLWNARDTALGLARTELFGHVDLLLGLHLSRSQTLLRRQVDGVGTSEMGPNSLIDVSPDLFFFCI